MKERHVYFLSACLIWIVSALLASAVFSKNSQLLALDAMARLATIIAGFYIGLDMVLAPETNLFYKINLYVPWSVREPGLHGLMGCIWITGHVPIVLDLIRMLAVS